MDGRLALAVAGGKLAGAMSRAMRRGGGTTLPGAVARRVDGESLSKLAARLDRGSIVITGTNGKTTTSRLVSEILRREGWEPVHNRAGANLLSGLLSALIAHSDSHGRIHADAGVFEVDEAVMPLALGEIVPKVLLITNLFRDQLDRYGEVNYLAGIWRQAVERLPSTSTVVLNADDPLVASLGEDLEARVLYFGVEDESVGVSDVEHAADSRTCLKCGATLIFQPAYYGHIGKYRCPDCGHARPMPRIAATAVSLEGVASTDVTVATPNGPLSLRLQLPGVYNVYNCLAACAGALALGASPESITSGVEGFTAAFGRIERVEVDNRTAFLALVKNPVGFNQVIRTIFDDAPTHKGSDGDKRCALILINDHFADGTDVSWLWDVDFERLRDKVEFVVVGGTRAEDMLVRLKYAEVETSRLFVAKDPAAALRQGIERTPRGGTLYVLPTYTAMLETRAALSRWGYVEHFWEN